MLNASEINKNELWTEMMKSMIYFTETSTALINRMQDKLGVSDAINITADMVAGDPFESIKRIQDQIDVFEKNSSVICKCTSSPPIEDDQLNSNEDISIGIEYYSQPRPLKKKKFKYSPNLETKILAQRKKRSSSCTCKGEGVVQHVDSCLCDDISKHPDLRTKHDDYFCPVVQCSSLEQAEIMNLQCENKILGETIGEKGIPGMEEISNEPLDWILKPESFNPNELPQDDSNPLILKGKDVLEKTENLLGYELFTAMEKFGGNIAQIDGETDQQETYDKFLEKCKLVAIKLKTNISRDGIVGIFTSNHMDCSIPYLAAIFNGNRVVTFDRTMTQSEISSCLQNVTPTIMFVSMNAVDHLKECMQAVQVDFPIVVFGDVEDYESFNSYIDGNLEETDNFQVNTDESLDSTAVLCFTSGTSEIPKAVCLSHRALLRQCFQMINSGNISSTILDFSEMCKVSSLLFLFCSVLNGSTRVITESFKAENIWNLIEKYKVRTMYLHPQQCFELSAYLEPNEDKSSLFCLFTGGEHLSPKVVKRLKEQLMGCLICQIYENTELSGATTWFKLADPADNSMLYCKPQSCGKALDGAWYKIVDLESGNIMSHSSTGELHVKSETIFNGYYVNNTEITDKTEWFKTGDLVYYDPNGCFHFVDRISNLIKYRNTVIMPSKLENILLSHPSVEMAVVIGVVHSEDTQQATGLVTLNDKDVLTSEELEEFVNKQVSDDEKLRGGVKIVQTIPRNNNGKIKRTDLLNLFLNEDTQQ